MEKLKIMDAFHLYLAIKQLKMHLEIRLKALKGV